jgi:hypothetical protein
MKKKPLEKTLYPRVARWMRRHFLCFRLAVNKGLRYGRIDVLGIRDVGGDFSGEVEMIAVEVKRGSTPFSNASGQTFGYRVYANRVYLADVREEPFNHDEIQIASCLGIGLIWIKGKSCREVLSSPYYKQITKLQLGLFEALRLGVCQLCDSLFRLGELQGGHYGNLCRENIKKAIKDEKGLVFWNRELADRKGKVGIRGDGSTTYERRFICPDCVQTVLAKLALAINS